jgi:hypothetical protein
MNSRVARPEAELGTAKNIIGFKEGAQTVTDDFF